MSLPLPVVNHSASSSRLSVAVGVCREDHAAKKTVSKNLTEMVNVGFRMELELPWTLTLSLSRHICEARPQMVALCVDYGRGCWGELRSRT